jgi:type VI protein secretion system component Hcp
MRLQQTVRWTLAILSMVVVASFGISPAAADVQGFMRVQGLTGESQVRGHEDEIELLSYTQIAGTNACFKAIVVKGLDKASPGLALLAVTNQLVTPITVTLTKSGENPFDAFTALLENVVVGNVELTEIDGGPIPTERVTLRPRRATLTYRLQLPDGRPGVPVTTVVNCP